jgi:hypothetical protein
MGTQQMGTQQTGTQQTGTQQTGATLFGARQGEPAAAGLRNAALAGHRRELR